MGHSVLVVDAMRYAVAVVLVERIEGSVPNVIETTYVHESESENDVTHAYRRLASGVTPKPKTSAMICGQLGPGEVRCELAAHRHDVAHSYRMVTDKGVLGTLYWEVDPDEGLLATWKPERGAFESEQDWKERLARYHATPPGRHMT